MKYEYLLFNIIVLSGPLFFGSQKRFYFLNHWKNAILSISLAAIPFLIWDVSVTNRHWFFANEYTMDLRILYLPIEEILFFITVPYACLFTWQMVKIHPVPFQLDYVRIKSTFLTISSIIIFIISIIALFYGKEYTSLAGLFFLLAILFDMSWGAKIIFHNRFIFFFILISLFTLIFNGYLTWRPIVTYSEIYQLDFRIYTIPIEDFFFGFALLIICTSIFERLLSKNISTESHAYQQAGSRSV